MVDNALMKVCIPALTSQAECIWRVPRPWWLFSDMASSCSLAGGEPQSNAGISQELQHHILAWCRTAPAPLQAQQVPLSANAMHAWSPQAATPIASTDWGWAGCLCGALPMLQADVGLGRLPVRSSAHAPGR